MGVSLFMILCILCDCWRRLAGTSSQIWRLDEIGMSFNLYWTCCMKVLPEAQPGDVLVFVFAGHGCQVRKLLHFLIDLAFALAWPPYFFNHFNIFHINAFQCVQFVDWIEWQVRLPGGELEDALVPCDSAQGVVPLAILASWKYWGRLKVVCFIKSVCPFLLICNDVCKCCSWNTPHLRSFWS